MSTASLPTRRRSRLALGRDRRNVAVRRIRYEPRTAVRGVVIFEPVQRARGTRELAERRRPLHCLLLALVNDVRELGGRHVLDLPARKLRGALEWNPALVAVGEHARDLRVTPGGAGWRP